MILTAQIIIEMPLSPVTTVCSCAFNKKSLSFKFFHHAADRSCYGNSHRLNKPGQGLLSNGIPYAIGPVQLCINSTYATVCNKGLNAYSATQLCHSIINPTSLGSPGLFGIDKNNLVYPLTSNALSDIQCPNEFFNSSACSFTFSSNNGCSDFGGDAVISCITCE